MNDRVNAALDGELPLAALNDAERAEVGQIRSAAEVLRASLPPAPAGLDAAVLRRVRELGLEHGGLRHAAGEHAGLGHAGAERAGSERAADAASRGWRGLFADLWRPRQVSFRLRPAWALVAVLAAGLLLVPLRGVDDGAPVVDAPPVFVQFRIEAHGAERVVLAGSFTDWQPAHELVEVRPGVWTVLVPLAPGVHDYAFLVDGERWVVDPAAPAIDDGFGGVNSRLALLPS